LAKSQVGIPVCSHEIISWERIILTGGSYIRVKVRPGAEVYAPVAGETGVGRVDFLEQRLNFVRITYEGKKVWIMTKSQIVEQGRQFPNSVKLGERLFVCTDGALYVATETHTFPLEEGGKVVAVCGRR